MSVITHKIDDREYLLVGIPNNYNDCRIVGSVLEILTADVVYSKREPYEPDGVDYDVEVTPLPPGTWQLVGTSDGIGEDVCAEIIGTDFPEGGYMLNPEKPFETDYAATYVQAFRSRLTSLQIDRCAIFQRVR